MDNNPNGQSADEANKRAALAGQWRTPPMPVFPSGVVPPQPQQQQQQQHLGHLPDSTEDYAKALQEAYRRGAEAAQAMAAQQPSQQQAEQSSMVPSTSCPDFQQEAILPAAQTGAVVEGKVSATAPTGTGSRATTPLMHPGGPTPTVPNPLSMPPPAPSHMNVITSTAAAAAAAPTAGVVPMPMAVAGGPTLVGQQPPHSNNSPPPLPQSPQQPPLPPPPAPLANTMGAVTVGSVPVVGGKNPNPLAPPTMQAPPPTAQRSMSLPDMSTYAAQQEEEKRQKRLARNRASARLRRLRKKNLVEAYEQEVGILEKTLSQLQAHEWGETDNVAALTEALSMDRGQQVLTFEQRHEAATGLLDQQLQWIEMLEEIMMEDYVLQNVRNGEFAELREILGLDEEQLNQIEESKVGWEEEWSALQTLKNSLVAMRENDWLWNENVSSIAEQFMGILHKNQVSKFLLWTDHNAEAIDELDGVNAYPGTPNGPLFAFGVESQPGENFGEEDK